MQKAMLEESHKPNKAIISDQSLSEIEKSKKVSKVIHVAFNKYLRFLSIIGNFL